MTSQQSTETDLRPVDPQWTARQREVLDLIARDLTNPEIAERLGITLGGAKWHVSEVLSKLSVGSREEAALYWRQQRSLSGRTKQWMHGLAGLGLLKWCAVAAATVAGGAAVLGVMMTYYPGRQDVASGLHAPQLPTTISGPLFTDARAAEFARSLAADVMNGQVVLASGRPLDSTDFQVLQSTFLPRASAVPSNVEGTMEELDPPADVWRFTLAEQPPEIPATATPPAPVVVIFEDGTGKFRAGGPVARDLNQDWIARYPPGAVIELATVHSDGQTYTVYAVDESSLPRSDSLPPQGWCVVTVTSRSPFGSGGGCGFRLPAVRQPLEILDFGTANGVASAMGLVSDDVMEVRLRKDDGAELRVVPSDVPPGSPLAGRMFFAVSAGGSFVTADAMATDGRVLGSYPVPAPTEVR